MAQSHLAEHLESKRFHVALLVVGLVFLLTGAFHGNVWFDESYSVSIANNSFAEIWDIGSGDVHPVLFYWALHVLESLFGQNLLVYRLFTVAGIFSLAILGLAVIRHDFGWKAGVLFSFFSLFTPYLAYISVEIRMYSWAIFSVMLCALYAWRIACTLRSKNPRAGDGSVEEGQKWWMTSAYDGSGRHEWCGVPCRWWLVLFLSSLASAYLHYYGVLAALFINLYLLIFIIVRAKKALPIFIAGAVIQVALYAPWLMVFKSQAGVVSGSYWANVSFPRTIVEWLFYPVYTSYVIFADTYGFGYVVILAVCAMVAAVSALYGLANWLRRSKQHDSGSKDSTFLAKRVLAPSALPAVWGVGLYASVFAAALMASMIMDSLIVYYRYLCVTVGPLLLAVSIWLSHMNCKICVRGLLAAFLGVSIVNQVLFVQDAYSSKNEEPLDYLEETAKSNSRPLVLSSDIGVEGVTAVECENIKQTFLAWQPGNWAHAYQSYFPTLTSVKSWDAALDGYQGTFIVLGQTQVEGVPVDVHDLEARDDVEVTDMKTFYRPYERTWFTVATMVKSSN